MKYTFSRRHILAQLAAIPISSAIECDAHGFAGDSNDGITEACVFAWNESKAGGKPVDLWTARCGSIDISRLSDQLGRFIFWDDIISDRNKERSIGEIKSAISHYFGISLDEHESNLAIHLGDAERVSQILSRALARFRSEETPSTGRIAIVDLTSCGVTRLQWRDLIPCLKQVYGTIVGLDYTDPYFSEADPAHYSAPYSMSKGSWQTLMACDYWAVASDNSLSRQNDLCFEARAALFTEALNGISEGIIRTNNAGVGFLLGAQKGFLGFGRGL